MMLPEHLSDLGKKFAARFGPLFEQLGDSKPLREAALVPVAGDRSQFICEGYRGGKNVEIVVVRAKKDASGKALTVRETLTYRHDIAGSDLVYDLTGEFMQGKARPFDCDLSGQPARVYALLPFQVDDLSLSANVVGGVVNMEIEFRDALGHRVEGVLPCHASVRGPRDKSALKTFLATSADGKLTVMADLWKNTPEEPWSLVVRSLLDGKEVKVPLEPGAKTGK